MGLIDVINDQGKRLYDKERDQTRGPNETLVVGTAVVQSLPTAGALTNTCRLRSSAVLTEVTLEVPADTPVTADATYDVLKTGVSIGSVTIASGADEGSALLNVGYSRGDQIRVEATTPGTGYTQATMHLSFSRTDNRFHPPVLLFPATGGTPVDPLAWSVWSPTGAPGTTFTKSAALLSSSDTFTVPASANGSTLDSWHIIGAGGGANINFQINASTVDNALALPGDVSRTPSVTVGTGDTIGWSIDGDGFANDTYVVAHFTSPGTLDFGPDVFEDWTP